MAKFHGFEIKNMKTWEGMEGYGTQGDVWLNGKKLGFWCNDGNGGEDNFEFPRDAVRKLDELVAEQVPECAIDLGNGKTLPADLSLVLAHLCDLKDLEKDWKKANKKGASLVALVSKETGEKVFYRIGSTNRGAITRWLIENAADEMNRLGFGDGHFEIYDSADCFVVGEPLEGAEDIVKRCAEWRKEREKFLADLAAKNRHVA